MSITSEACTMTLSLTLASGDRMPVVGLGLWKVPREICSDLMQQAIRVGYRHLDCACDYGNEVEVGSGVRAAVSAGTCRRQDLWITSKLWNTYHRAEHVRSAVERSLRDLHLDYLDLYLIHFPIAQAFVPFDARYPPEWFYDPQAPEPHVQLAKVPLSETWMAMEELVSAGLVRNIGVCNYNCALLRDLLSYARIHPAALQVELHPYLSQQKLLRFCKENRIAVTGFSPLGALSYVELGMAGPEHSVLQEPMVRAAAQRHGKTPAQVVLRWAVQRGTAIVPKTVRLDRLVENLTLFDFKLSTDEMGAVSALNRDSRFNDPGVFCEAAFHTFCPVYE
jgi:diketogulonate reductase-like aldo/keto reductase